MTPKTTTKQNGQMGGSAQTQQPQQQAGQTAPQQGDPAPQLRLTDWASI